MAALSIIFVPHIRFVPILRAPVIVSPDSSTF
jgi:hypothetical protein